MTLKQYLFEGGGQGAAVTAANRGASLVLLNGASITYDTSMAAHGSYGVKVVSALNKNSLVRLPAATAANQMSISFVCTIPAAVDAVPITLAAVQDSTGAWVLQLRLQTDGSLLLIDAGTVTTILAAAGSFTLGSPYRFTFVLTGGSTTTGAYTVKMYSGSTQIGSTAISSTANLRTNPIGFLDVGIVSTNNAAGIIVGVDDVQLDDGATSAPSPVVDTAPVAGTVTDNLARIVASAGTAPYTIAQTSGTTTAPISDGSGQWLIPKHATDTLVYKITDSVSQTATVSVAPIPTGTIPNWPKRPSGTIPGNAWA